MMGLNNADIFALKHAQPNLVWKKLLKRKFAQSDLTRKSFF
jgi:hypothetical protein